MNLLQTLVGLLILALVTACGPAAQPPPEPASSAPSGAGAPTAEAVLLDVATYVDEARGFELDYPAGWSVLADAQVGVRGSQALILSPGTTAEALADGGSRLSISIYDWDPKGDLEAYASQRRHAWEASGNTVVDGSLTELLDGRPAADFFIQASDGALSYFLLTTNADQYVQLAGEGDLVLVETIARTFRPIGFQPR